MFSDQSYQPRRFICGSCYTEFSTLPALTHHAEVCFNSEQQQLVHHDASSSNYSTITMCTDADLQVHHYQGLQSPSVAAGTALTYVKIPNPGTNSDESALAVETLTYSGADVISADLSAPRTVAYSANNSVSGRLNAVDLFTSVPTGLSPLKVHGGELHQHPNTSSGNFASAPEFSDRPLRVRGKNLSLAGIRVTAGVSTSVAVPANSDETIEYRGSAIRIGIFTPSKKKCSRKSYRREKKTSIVVSCTSEARRELAPFSNTENSGQLINCLDLVSSSGTTAPPPTVSPAGDRVLEINGDAETSTSQENSNAACAGDSNDCQTMLESDTLDKRQMRAYPHNVRYKSPCTGPRQKWRYLPADQQNVRLPNGRIKTSYRIHCPLCHQVLWRQNLQQHMRYHTGQRPYKCSQCPKTFASSTDLKKHLVTHQDRDQRLSYRCPFCTWTGLANLRRHVRLKHPGAEFDPANVVTELLPPRQANVVMPEPSEATEGEMARTEAVVEDVFQAVVQGTFQLNDDELWEFAVDSVEAQLRRGDSSEQAGTWCVPRVECNVCWRVIGRSSFASHRRIHEGVKPFSCLICSKTFRWKKRLVHHLNVHSGQRPHVCDDCGERFLSPSQLRHHRVKYHKSGKGNSNTNELASQTVPWKIRKTVCYVCGLMISQPRMAGHLREHSDGVRIHHCDQCSKKYRTSYFLRLHKARTHEGVSPYKCLKCDFRSQRREPVVEHMWDIHQEIIDRSVALIQGITTLNHLPTRKCSDCGVFVFHENYSIHQKKHTRPDEYERLRQSREEIFQRDVYKQRNNRNPDLHSKRKNQNSRRRSQRRTSTQLAARRILNVIRQRNVTKLSEESPDHNYSGNCVTVSTSNPGKSGNAVAVIMPDQEVGVSVVNADVVADDARTSQREIEEGDVMLSVRDGRATRTPTADGQSHSSCSVDSSCSIAVRRQGSRVRKPVQPADNDRSHNQYESNRTAGRRLKRNNDRLLCAAESTANYDAKLTKSHSQSRGTIADGSARKSSRIIAKTQKFREYEDLLRNESEPNEPVVRKEKASVATKPRVIPRYQCLLCKTIFQNISELIVHDRIHNTT